MSKTFRAADGRRVIARMSAEQAAELKLYRLLVVTMPVATILLFAFAAGML